MEHARLLRWFFLSLLALGVSGCTDGLRGGVERPVLGPRVIREPAAWWGASNAWVRVYSQEADWLDDALGKVSFARGRAARVLGVSSDRMRVVSCYVVRDPALWGDVAEKYAIHPDTVSLSLGNEVVCLAGAEEDLAGDSLPHELVHVLLQQDGRRVPLAIEEGLALYFGWEINLEYHLSRGELVPRKKERAGRGRWTVDELLAVKKYPRNPEELLLFYAQAERLVQGVNTLIGTSAIPAFLKSMSEGDRSWRAVLAEEFACTPEQIGWLERAVETPQEPRERAS